MPIYDYRCPEGHIFERFSKSQDFSDEIPCAECSEVAKWLPSFGNSADAQRFAPVVIHRDALGNVRFPGSTDSPVPHGFEKVELKDFHAIRAFEREMNLRDSVKSQEFSRAQERFREGQLAENRRAMQDILNGGAWERKLPNGQVETLHGLTPRGRAFYEAMRKASEGRQHRAKDPVFCIEAFSQNASNRDEHRDASTGWKGRK